MSRILTVCTLAATLLVGGCDTGTEPSVPTSLRLDLDAATLALGDKALAQVQVLDQHGSVMQPMPPEVSVQWSSNAHSVATVQGGTITAHSAGQATITASAAGLESASMVVTVIPGTLSVTDGTFDLPIVTRENFYGEEPSSDEVSGTLSFSYTGHRQGQFAAAATFHFNQLGPTGTQWAVTFHDANFQGQDIIALRQRADGRFDLFWIWSDGAPVTGASTRQVSGGELYLGLADAGPQEVYVVTEGTIQFGEPAGDRVSGTFSLELEQDFSDGTAASTGGFAARHGDRLAKVRELLERARD